MLKSIGLDNIGFGQFPAVWEGLGSYRRLVGLIPTYPDTSPTPWCQVMTQTLEVFFAVHGRCLHAGHTGSLFVRTVVNRFHIFYWCCFSYEAYVWFSCMVFAVVT